MNLNPATSVIHIQLDDRGIVKPLGGDITFELLDDSEMLSPHINGNCTLQLIGAPNNFKMRLGTIPDVEQEILNVISRGLSNQERAQIEMNTIARITDETQTIKGSKTFIDTVHIGDGNIDKLLMEFDYNESRTYELRSKVSGLSFKSMVNDKSFIFEDENENAILSINNSNSRGNSVTVHENLKVDGTISCGPRRLSTTQLYMRQGSANNSNIHKAGWICFSSVLDEDSNNIIYRNCCMDNLNLCSASVSFDNTFYKASPFVNTGGEQYRVCMRLIFYMDTHPSHRYSSFNYHNYHSTNAMPNGSGSQYMGEILIRSGWNHDLRCQSYIDSSIICEDGDVMSWRRGESISCFLQTTIEGSNNPNTRSFNYNDIPNEFRITLGL